MSSEDYLEYNSEIERLFETFVDLRVDVNDDYNQQEAMECFKGMGIYCLDEILNGTMSEEDIVNFIDDYNGFYECGADAQVTYIDIDNDIDNDVNLHRYLEVSESEIIKSIIQYNQRYPDNEIKYNHESVRASVIKKYMYYKLGKYRVFHIDQ
jgi:hypothetical protein